MSRMNWGKLNRVSKGGGRRGANGGRGAGGAVDAATAGLDAAWKDISLPKEGDVLQCKHFNVCSGCEYDRRFDETPMMVDSRCGDCSAGRRVEWEGAYLGA